MTCLMFLVIIVSNSTYNLFVDGKYCLTFTEPQPIDRTDFNTGFISTLNTCQYVWVRKNQKNHGFQVIIESQSQILKQMKMVNIKRSGTRLCYCVKMIILQGHCKQVAQSENSPFHLNVEQYCPI
ncbi:hypothetical protein ACTFIR_000363 [Dictyostelium discoideum]